MIQSQSSQNSYENNLRNAFDASSNDDIIVALDGVQYRKNISRLNLNNFRDSPAGTPIAMHRGMNRSSKSLLTSGYSTNQSERNEPENIPRASTRKEKRKLAR